MEGAMGEVRRIAVEDAPPLEELLAAVERGETVDLVRDDRVVARMGPRPIAEMTGEEMLATMRALRAGRTLGDIDVRAAIEEGRM